MGNKYMDGGVVVKPLLRVTAPHFTAGLEVGGLAAPIVAYMRGWSIERVKTYCARKGWKLEEL